MAEWLDIASAPKDGTIVLLAFPATWFHREHGTVGEGRWRDYDTIPGHWVVRDRFATEPTHWQPLPKGPTHE